MKNGFYQDEHGIKVWYKNTKRHRLNGPATIYQTFRYWLIDDKYHRLDGMAFYGIVRLWLINGNDITDNLNDYCIGNNIDIKSYQNLSLSDKLKLKFKFGLQL